jgi:nucleotide-binding universal stress UspA family protein
MRRRDRRDRGVISSTENRTSPCRNLKPELLTISQAMVFMKVLLAIDNSDYSADAIKEVAKRPWPQKTIVRLLSVVEPLPPPAAELWYDASGSLERARQELTKRATKLTKKTCETLKGKGLKVESAVREGDARSAIVDEARKWSADLIVLGSHGYSGIKRLLLGSVAYSVASHAPCSVEIVRRKQTKKSP